MELKGKILVDVQTLAELLSLPVSFLEEQASPRGRGLAAKKGRAPIPMVKIGKYNRYDVEKVKQWITQFDV
jgi:hypothetical protein